MSKDFAFIFLVSWYNEKSMNKNVLLAGKDYNKSTKINMLAKQSGLNAFITTQFEKTDEKPTPSKTDWNRANPVSTRSIVLNAENELGSLDGAVLFFDTKSFNQHFTKFTAEELNRATDELILSYTYMTCELLKRFERKNHGKLFFVLQNMQTASDYLKSSSREQVANPTFASPITSMAQAAFKTFAENTAAANYNQTAPNFIYLLEVGEETDEAQIIQWISKKLEQENPVYKNSKNAVTWQTTEEKSKFSLPFMR